MKNNILEGLAETFFYNCSRCGKSNLSRDEVMLVKHCTPIDSQKKQSYLCDECAKIIRGEYI